MQPPDGEHEPACPVSDGTERYFRGRYGPLSLLLILFALLDFFVPFTARHIAGEEVEPTNSLGFDDVFGTGRWPIRFVLMIGASAGCYGLSGTQLLGDIDNWSDALRGPALIPLEFLAAAAPFAAWRIRSGRKLSKAAGTGPGDAPIGLSSRRFAIRDLLAVTAFVAVALALARWTVLLQGADTERIAAIAFFTLSAIFYSTIYMVPLAWGLLAPSRSRRALIFSLVYAALWLIVPTAFSVSGNKSAIELGLTIGAALGLAVTAPISLLIWRWCGWRLT